MIDSYTCAAAGSPWYVVRVRSNFEHIAHQVIMGKGYESFLPTYKSKRVWSDRTKEISLPLYPGYVFCRFDFDRRLPIITTPGVVEVINDGRRGLPVEETEIAAIRKIVGADLRLTPWPYLRVGQRVEVRRGPLQGVEGILLAQKKNFRLIVSIELLQRSVNVEIEGDWVRPLETPVPRDLHSMPPNTICA